MNFLKSLINTFQLVVIYMTAIIFTFFVHFQPSQAFVGGSWVRLPANGVVTGKSGGLGPLAVCRASFDGGQHPGKLWQGDCNFEWGFQDHFESNFEVLLDNGYSWINPGRFVINNFGQQVWTVDGLPSNAVDGGDAGNAASHTRLGICQAYVAADNTWHPGKFYANSCNIAWGGSRTGGQGGERQRRQRKVGPDALGNVLVLVK